MDNLQHFVMVPLRILVSLLRVFFLTTNPLVLQQKNLEDQPAQEQC